MDHSTRKILGFGQIPSDLAPQFELSFDETNLVRQVCIVCELTLDLAEAVLDGGVVSTPKLSTELWEGQAGVCTGQEHSDLARTSQRSRALRPSDVGTADVVQLGHGLDDLGDGDVRLVGREQLRHGPLCELNGDGLSVERMLRLKPREDAFHLADVASYNARDDVCEVHGQCQPNHICLSEQDGDERLAVGRLHICEQTTFEAGAQARHELVDVAWWDVRGQHNLAPGSLKRVEGVEELFLCPVFSRQELDVVY